MKATIPVRTRKISFPFGILILLIVTGSLLIGCNNADDGDAHVNNVNGMTDNGNLLDVEITEEAVQLVEMERSEFYGETLTIATFSDLLIRDIVRLYMLENPGVTIEVIELMDEDFREARERIGVELMAGTGPVLLNTIFVDNYDPRIGDFLVDWFTIMAADPYFNEEDWFMNVFHAVAVNGQLNAFPVLFAHEIVMANSTIPGLREALADRDTVSILELMEIYQEYRGQWPHFLSENYDVAVAMFTYLDRFLDIEAGIVDFDNQAFIDFITRAREITSPDKAFGYTFSTIPISPDLERELSERYFFITTMSVLYQYHLNFETELLFTDLTPLTNDEGELIIDPWQSFALNALATPTEQALAWDFIRFMTDARNYGGGAVSWVNMSSPNRELFLLGVEHNLIGFRDHFERYGWRLTHEEEAFADVAAQMVAFAELPMVNARRTPHVIFDIIFEALELFHDGLVSAQQTAADLQSRITLVLMEMGMLN